MDTLPGNTAVRMPTNITYNETIRNQPTNKCLGSGQTGDFERQATLLKYTKFKQIITVTLFTTFNLDPPGIQRKLVLINKI